MTIRQPALLNITAPHKTFVGGSQYWYTDHWHRMSGCGPTAASNLIWYLSRSRPTLSALCAVADGSQAAYQTLQRDMFTFITPGMGGVNTSTMFVDGALRYAKAHGVTLQTSFLDIPKRPFTRPTLAQTRDFLLTALQADVPVAFLNLSNGTLTTLDGWHWVTILGYDPTTNEAQISDQGNVFAIPFAEWWRTSLLGGALVTLQAQTSQ